MTPKISKGFIIAALGFLSACGGSSVNSNLTPARTINANTTFIQNVTTTFQATIRVCPQVSRTTTSCQSSRQALGLSGNWLNFSCNVVEGLATASLASTSVYSNATYVTLSTQDLPDYTSNY